VELIQERMYSDEEQHRLSRSLTTSILEAACNARNYDSVLQIVTLIPRYKDATFAEQDSTKIHGGTRMTNLLCWAVRHRNLHIVGRLLQLGVDINSPEPDKGGLSAVMICVKWLVSSMQRCKCFPI
jgi:hypothetical protein